MEQKLIVPELSTLMTCPAFYGTRRFITVFTRAVTAAYPESV
jgi:hypothetical protein